MIETRPPAHPWPWIQGAVALLVLALFLWTLGGVLNPLLVFLVLVALLAPYRRLPGHSLVLGVTAVLTLFWMLSTTGTLLAPFVVALGLAYLLDPAVDRLQERGLPRSLGILLLALPVAALLVVGVVVGLPALGAQIEEVIQQVPVLLTRLDGWLGTLETRVRGVPLVGEELQARLRALDSEAVVTLLEERQAMLVRRTWSGILGLGRGLGSILTILGYVVLTPVLTFYLLRDWDRLTNSVATLLPERRRDSVVTFAREYDVLLARYLRGQVLVAVIIGTVTALGLWVARFPYAFLIGVVVAVFSVVPYLGLVLSLIPALIIALVSGNVVASLVKVAVVFGVAQGLEGAVVSPRIVGDSVGLHPVWVVLALAMGGSFFGFVGLLLAVPAAVGVKLLVVRGLTRWRESALYLDEGPAA